MTTNISPVVCGADSEPSIAVAIPCLNEAPTIASVINEFVTSLPRAKIYVFDNGSTDESAEVAKKHDVTVVHVPLRGKGRVLRAILERLPEDIVIIVDGDHTYFAEDARHLIEPLILGEADMVVGNRFAKLTGNAITPLHRFGNYWITAIINLMFGAQLHDILSGFRAVNRRFREHVAVLTNGFEIETELTIRALLEELQIREIPISYRSRPMGSESKLRAFRDGYRILLTAAMLLRDFHPLRIFGTMAIATWGVSLFAFIKSAISSAPPAENLVGIGTSLFWVFFLSGLILLCTGMILNAVNTRFRELHQLQLRRRAEP